MTCVKNVFLAHSSFKHQAITAENAVFSDGDQNHSLSVDDIQKEQETPVKLHLNGDKRLISILKYML